MNRMAGRVLVQPSCPGADPSVSDYRRSESNPTDAGTAGVTRTRSGSVRYFDGTAGNSIYEHGPCYAVIDAKRSRLF